MNYLGMSLLLLGNLGAVLAAGNLDGTTNIPLGAFLGMSATLFLTGMWVSKKVTKFEEQHVRFAEQQMANIQRIDALDARLVAFEEQQSANFLHINEKLSAFNERLWHAERKS